MGFCTKQQHRRFLELCPVFESYVATGGIKLFKIWLEVSNEEQERRFQARIEDPLRQWKLSPVDLPSRSRWYEYSRARDMMLEARPTPRHRPGTSCGPDDKERARLSCIAHFLSLIPYERVKKEKVEMPKRSPKGAYDDEATLKDRRFVAERY